MILDCQNISKAFGTNVILDNVSFHLEDKEKMAIVGINGAGKTTLLKIIMQEEEADSGQIVLSKDRTIGYLSQHQDIFYDDTVYGVMEDAMKPVIELQDKIRKLEQDMTTLTGNELTLLSRPIIVIPMNLNIKTDTPMKARSPEY